MTLHRCFVFTCAIILFGCAPNKMSLTSINTNSYKTYEKKISKELSMSYIEEGEGDETLIFIHGLGSDKKAWAKNIMALKSKYRCIAVDLPGYGSSSSGDFSYDMRFFSESLSSFIRKKKIKNPILVGHSMGGQIVLYTLINNPNIADRAVLIAPAGIEQFSEKETNWMKMVYTGKVVRAATDEQIATNLKLNFNNYPADAEFMIEDRIELKTKPKFDAYVDMIPKCVAGMLDQPVANQLDQIKAKVLLLFGSNDQLIPNKYLHANETTSSIAVNGAGAISNSQLEIWQNCGHMLQWECAEATNRAIDTFISSD